MKTNNKKLPAALLIVAVFPVVAYLHAAMFEQSDISQSKKGRLVLEKKQADDSIARNDRVLLINGSDTCEVFASEGSAIQEIIEEDLDLDGEKELLIQMDLGGSGGFKEFVLLQFKNGKYETIWEETGFKAGDASIEDRDGDGRPNLYILYVDAETTPAQEKTAAFTLTNGELKPVE